MEFNAQTKASLKLLEERMQQYSKCELTFTVVKAENVRKIYNGAIVFFNEKDTVSKQEGEKLNE